MLVSSYLDNLGSPAVVTDESGNVIKEYRYYAFGNLRSQSGSFNTDYSFTGYLKEETGNHYAKMRYYEGGIGRFLRVDPLGALNPYAYCGNDPLNFVDPEGLSYMGVVVWGGKYLTLNVGYAWDDKGNEYFILGLGLGFSSPAGAYWYRSDSDMNEGWTYTFDAGCGFGGSKGFTPGSGWYDQYGGILGWQCDFNALFAWGIGTAATVLDDPIEGGGGGDW